MSGILAELAITLENEMASCVHNSEISVLSLITVKASSKIVNGGEIMSQ